MKLFSICAKMKWNHLPIGGGLYDQSPKLIDDFTLLFAMESEAEREKREREKREADKQKNQSSKGKGRRRR